MLSLKCVWPLAAVVLMSSWTVCLADEKKGAEAASGAAQTVLPPEEIAKLIAQLDADRYADRQAASDKLAAAGKAAIPALAKAAVGDSLEATVRAIDILKKFFESSDEATKTAAKAALESVAKSDRPAAARRAQDVLKPKAASTEEPAPAGGNNAPGGGIIIGNFGGGIIQGQIQVGVAAAGNGKKVSVKVANGVKEVDAEEGDKKIKITDDPQNGIKIEVTTKKDGKDKTDKYEAKDADELKKKHPEGYKIYQEYAEKQGGVQIQIGVAGAAPGLPVPAAPAIRLGGRLRGPNAAAGGSIEMATRLVQSLGKQIETLTKNENLQTASQESKDELKKQLGDLKQQLADLEKRLQDDPNKKPAEKAATPEEKK